jgi:hypothetical protein
VEHTADIVDGYDIGWAISPDPPRITVQIRVDEPGGIEDSVVPSCQMMKTVFELLSPPGKRRVVRDDPLPHQRTIGLGNNSEDKALGHAVDTFLALLAVDAARKEEEVRPNDTRLLAGLGP